MSAHKVVSLVFVAALLSITFGQASAGPAPAASPADSGIIAYVRLSTHDIHLISPDGLVDKVLWTAPKPLGPWGPLDLAWRPDGRVLAFSGDHETACSWYESDVYAIGYDGAGYRRITNAPACAVLASLPKGSVTVNVSNWTNDLVQVYVQGAPGLQSVLPYESGTLTFTNVADLGPGVLQPPVGIYGLYRVMPSPPFADVKPGETVPGGNLIFSQSSGIRFFGTGKVSWKADGSALAYAMRSGFAIGQIPANPPYGSTGVDLPMVERASSSLVDWGPTPATKDQYLYYSASSPFKDNVDGIYLNTAGDTSGGTKLVNISNSDAQHVKDIEWLPDGSGFVFTLGYVNFEIYSDIFDYNFETHDITRLTPILLDETGDGGARSLSISPGGEQIVFERAVYPFDSPSSLWIMNRDGSDLHKLASDAGRPAWGQTPPPPAAYLYLPTVVRGR